MPWKLQSCISRPTTLRFTEALSKMLIFKRKLWATALFGARGRGKLARDWRNGATGETAQGALWEHGERFSPIKMLEEKLKTKLKLSKKRGAEKSVEGSGVARKKSGKKKHAVEASESAAVDSAETAKKSKIWRTTCTTSVQSYVNDLAWGGQHSIAAALGSGAVNLYEAQPAELRLVQANKYHAGQASQLKFQPESPRVLYSCGGDGAVVAWDGRSNQVVQR